MLSRLSAVLLLGLLSLSVSSVPSTVLATNPSGPFTEIVWRQEGVLSAREASARGCRVTEAFTFGSGVVGVCGQDTPIYGTPPADPRQEYGNEDPSPEIIGWNYAERIVFCTAANPGQACGGGTFSGSGGSTCQSFFDSEPQGYTVNCRRRRLLSCQGSQCGPGKQGLFAPNNPKVICQDCPYP